MLRIHLFSIFTIKTPRTLATLALLGFLIVNTLTNVLSLLFGDLNYWKVHTSKPCGYKELRYKGLKDSNTNSSIVLILRTKCRI